MNYRLVAWSDMVRLLLLPFLEVLPHDLLETVSDTDPLLRKCLVNNEPTYRFANFAFGNKGA